MFKLRTIIGLSLALALTAASIQLLEAQTWRAADSKPPDQIIPPIVLMGDNLGGTGQLCINDVTGCALWSHKARYNLNMDQWPITSIGNNGESKPALEAESSKESKSPGAQVSAENGIAVSVRSQSTVKPALGAFSRGAAASGYGLWVDSPGGDTVPEGLVSGIISSRLTLLDASMSSTAHLQIGANSLDRLATASASGLNSKLYFGQALLCSPDSSGRCGFGSTGYTVHDNLGLVNPHQGLMNLNLQSNRIIGASSALANESAVATMHTGIDAGTRVTNNGSGSRGVTSALNGKTLSDKPGTTGIYANHLGAAEAPGLIAASTSGWAARISGQLQVTGQVAGQYAARVQLAKEENTLAFSSLLPASDDLYWGDKKLCTANSTDCGWSKSVGNSDHWQKNNDYNIYFNNYLSGSQWLSNVGIGTASPQYVLDVAGATRVTQATIGNLRANSVTVAGNSYLGNELYVSTNVTVANPGAVINGSVGVSTNGLLINGIRLNEADLLQIINACKADGVCT
ncbi:MAG: hypothetical protein V1846_01500 [Candidatus Komeilibacteria bacterium]